MSERNNKINFKKILQSIFSALLGVQSQKNMEKDIEYGKIHHYVIAGVILVIIILVTIYSIVNLVIR